jgi:hypothetical protein
MVTKKNEWTGLSCRRDTKELILKNVSRAETCDAFLKKLLILKSKHEEEFANLKVTEL